MGKQAFKYVLICMGIYLLMAAIEIFLFKYLIDLFNTGFRYHLIVYSILLLAINPVVTKILGDKCLRKIEKR